MSIPMSIGKVIPTIKILGLDPGVADLGFGVILKNGSKIEVQTYGSLKTLKDKAPAQRLLELMTGLEKIIKKEKPSLAVVESLFFAKNVTTGMAVSQARGVILVTLEKFGIPILELTPPQVKQCLCGYGRADKKQIQKMVQILLKLKEIPKPDDAADALALAICGTSWRMWPAEIKKKVC